VFLGTVYDISFVKDSSLVKHPSGLICSNNQLIAHLGLHMLLMPENFRRSLLIFGKFNVGFEKLVWVSKVYWYSMVLSALELGKI
jgi:hypothetical protein